MVATSSSLTAGDGGSRRSTDHLVYKVTAGLNWLSMLDHPRTMRICRLRWQAPAVYRDENRTVSDAQGSVLSGRGQGKQGVGRLEDAIF